MNYKIKVTEENREAIKEIAERNGMNENGLNFTDFRNYYIIENNKFWASIKDNHQKQVYQKLTFEQFKAMFDQQETDLEKWLREIKAKNLSLDKLWNEVGRSSAKTGRQLKGESISDKALILYNQWNKPKPQAKIIGYEMIKDFPNIKNKKVGDIFLLEDNENFKNFSDYPEFLKPVFEDTPTESKTEWQPKRGDRVLVWDNCEKDAVERIFLAEIKGIKYPIITVHLGQEKFFIENQEFSNNNFKHMKPLPIAPTEPEKTFKDKVIELAEEKIKELEKKENEFMKASIFSLSTKYSNTRFEIKNLLTKIKELN